MTDSTIARTKRATVWLAACLLLVPLAPVGHGAPAESDAACDVALAGATTAIEATPNATAREALEVLNAAGPACGFDLFANATTYTPAPANVRTSLCPMTGGVGATLLVLDIRGTTHSFRDAAMGAMAPGHIETEGAYLGMRATGNSGHVRVGPLVLPALEGGDADVVCGSAQGDICVTFLWVFEKCADASVGMACRGEGEAYVLNSAGVRVYGKGMLKSPAPCRAVAVDVPVNGGLELGKE